VHQSFRQAGPHCRTCYHCCSSGSVANPRPAPGNWTPEAVARARQQLPDPNAALPHLEKDSVPGRLCQRSISSRGP
jgi:hypothetical protein